MGPLLLLLACAPAELGPAEESARSAVEAGPGGPEVPTNAVPWAFFPGESSISGERARAVRVVDASGREVRTTPVVTSLAAGARVQAVPAAPLAPGREYRILVPGELSKSFRTAKGPDRRPPTGGGLRDWSWEGGTCPTLTLGYAPVGEGGWVAWEVEASRPGREVEPTRLSAMVPASAVTQAPPLKLRGCDGQRLPRATVDVRLRWVDLAGNAGPWSDPVRVHAQTEYAAASVTGGLSVAP